MGGFQRVTETESLYVCDTELTDLSVLFMLPDDIWVNIKPN